MATINPFQGPINYSVDVQSPFEAAIGGFKLGAAGAEAQAQAQVREQAKKAQTELATLFKNPNATATDFARVSSMLPRDQAESVLKSFELMSTSQQKNRLQESGQVYTAMKSGQLDIAKTLLQKQADAFRTGGKEQEAKATETYLQLVDMNPTGAQTTIGLMIATMPGGKELLENVDKTLSTGRAEALAPEELRQKIAAADEAVAAATTAKATATNAAETAAADLKKKAADLGLTSAQTDSALAQGKKFGAEASAALLELEALKKGGALATPKAFDQEEKLRKEYQARTKMYGELGTTLSNIQSSAKAQTGQGDVALITQFMKMIDPGAVVRETDFAIARDTAGLYTKLENALKKAEAGQFLQPNQRSDFVNLAKQYHDAAKLKADEDKKALGVVVKNYRLNPENVFGPEPAADPNSVTVGGKTYTRPANFTDDQWGAYKQSVGAQ